MLLVLSMVMGTAAGAEPDTAARGPGADVAAPAVSGPSGALGPAPATGVGRLGASPSPSPPSSPGGPGPSAAQLGAPSATAVQAALEFAPLTRYAHDISGGAYTNTGNTGGHTYVLAMAARAGDGSVDARLLEQLRHVLTGGNDIAANGGYPAQHELQTTGALSVVRRVPRVWDQLTGDQQARADAMMTASLVGNAFTTSDHNPYVTSGSQQYTLDGDDNVNRGWNPNYREGMVGSVLVAAAYFGLERARQLLGSYDHGAFVAELDALGLTNAHRTFTYRSAHPDSPAPTGDQVEQAVRDWSVRGVGLGDPMRLYADLTAHTFGATVECGHEGEGVPAGGAPGGIAGMIDSGCDGLPNAGRDGMLLEFASVDAGGVRSSAVYAYGGFKPNLFTRLAMIDAGLWDPRPELAEVLDLIHVGAEDLWYKLAHGYRNHQHGEYRGTLSLDSDGWGFRFLRTLWREVYLGAS